MSAGASPANSEELAVIQQGAKAWNEWRGKNKERVSFNLSGADLHNRDVTDADLRAVDLSNANLRGATLGPGTLLWNAKLSNADLYQANLRGADLQDVNFSNADLYQADLRESNLQGADLSTAKGGLLSRQLAGSDLTGAKLPEPLAKLYDSLSSVKEISDSAQKLFLALLAGCLYSWLTIAQTTDVELITNRASTPLPIIQAAIPIVGFYVVAPLILLCLYFYFHFYLQKLWEELGSLPALFTDGRELHKRTDPWLLNDLVRSHFVKLKDGRPFLSYFQSWISVVLAWWLVPVTLFAFWLRFLRRHDLLWTMVHALLLALVINSAVRLYSIANRTLRGEGRPGFRFRGMLQRRSTYLQAVFAILLGALIIAMSLGTIFGDLYWPPHEARMGFLTSSPRTWMPWLLHQFGYYAFANFDSVDVSIKPPNWTGKNDNELDLVKGAKLTGSNLRNIYAPGAFFVTGQLDWSDLRNSQLEAADLRQANLNSANLEKANLGFASLESSDLDRAYMRNVTLAFANLRDATLRSADLRGADFEEADLTRANLEGSNLNDAKFGVHLKDLPGVFLSSTLKYADFRDTSGLTVDMVVGCTDYEYAFYPPDMLKQLGLSRTHNEKLQKQMEAELKQAKTSETKSANQK
ncbi:MAG TPA: pentapeptide repeat-containing protein [Candidatus Angelobacter sp.]|jgi:uncharacterized protein YjbI with pentapeptide repeats